MEKDFHYFLVYALARVAEIEKADIVAYASQFVDDNNEGQFSINGRKVAFPEMIPENGGHYFPIMTQSLSIDSLNPYIQKYVYTPFHFLPGDSQVPIKGKTNPLSTTPDSKNAQRVLKSALDSEDPYQVGIALHTYADTWSHQNFSGIREDWNSVYPWYNIFKSIVPNIGHAEVGHSPDVLSETWTDHRLGSNKIENWERGLQAAAKIHQTLRRRTKAGPLWRDIQQEIKAVVTTPDYDMRIAKTAEFLDKRNCGSIPKYDKNVWIDEALDRKNGEVKMAANFQRSHWYRFHQAAKRHFSYILDLLKDL